MRRKRKASQTDQKNQLRKPNPVTRMPSWKRRNRRKFKKALRRLTQDGTKGSSSLMRTDGSAGAVANSLAASGDQELRALFQDPHEVNQDLALVKQFGLRRVNEAKFQQAADALVEIATSSAKEEARIKAGEQVRLMEKDAADTFCKLTKNARPAPVPPPPLDLTIDNRSQTVEVSEPPEEVEAQESSVKEMRRKEGLFKLLQYAKEKGSSGEQS